MNIHEYQAKELLAKFGVPVPAGAVAYTAAEAVEAAQRLGGEGRGRSRRRSMPAAAARRAGSSSRAREDEVAAAATRCSAQTLVTHQTGPEGRDVKRVYVEAGCDIARELYLALSIDRATGRITIIAAAEGGMDIEELAAHAPDKIVREAIDPAAGLSPFYARRLGFAFGLSGRRSRQAGRVSSARSIARSPSSTPR